MHHRRRRLGQVFSLWFICCIVACGHVRSCRSIWRSPGPERDDIVVEDDLPFAAAESAVIKSRRKVDDLDDKARYARTSGYGKHTSSWSKSDSGSFLRPRPSTSQSQIYRPRTRDSMVAPALYRNGTATSRIANMDRVASSSTSRRTSIESTDGRSLFGGRSSGESAPA